MGFFEELGLGRELIEFVKVLGVGRFVLFGFEEEGLGRAVGIGPFMSDGTLVRFE